jgi:tetratricopeptide (TPR) repeat protein
MDPNFTPAMAHLGRIYSVKGMYDEAFAVFERLRTIDSEYYNLDMMVAYAHARAGNREESLRILDRLTALADTQQGNAFEIGVLHAGLGNFDEAFEWIEKGIENRQFPVVLMDATTMLDDLRNDPRFEEMRRKIHLPPAE